MVLGGPLSHVMAAKAVAFAEARTPEFRTYAQAVADNAQALAEACMAEGLQVLTGGTDNHLLLVDVGATYGLTGRQAESALRECAITLNRNALPFDPHGPWYTSGLRLGTPAVTTLGMGVEEMREIARVIALVLGGVEPATTSKGERGRVKYALPPAVAAQARERIGALLGRFPLYPQLEASIMEGFGL
jgi:glycine hydroxymethyltransferase